MNLAVGSSFLNSDPTQVASISGWEEVEGTELADTITGSIRDETLSGGGGIDTCVGGGGTDIISNCEL